MNRKMKDKSIIIREKEALRKALKAKHPVIVVKGELARNLYKLMKLEAVADWSVALFSVAPLVVLSYILRFFDKTPTEYIAVIPMGVLFALLMFAKRRLFFNARHHYKIGTHNINEVDNLMISGEFSLELVNKKNKKKYKNTGLNKHVPESVK
ncbi:hypothetical protein ACFL6I_17355 [candidate division KSB1 bacterium]